MFCADIGIDQISVTNKNPQTNRSSANFRVYADDTLLYDSQQVLGVNVGYNTPALSLEVAIPKGSRQLILVTDKGDNNNYEDDHTDWGNACFRMASESCRVLEDQIEKGETWWSHLKQPADQQAVRQALNAAYAVQSNAQADETALVNAALALHHQLEPLTQLSSPAEALLLDGQEMAGFQSDTLYYDQRVTTEHIPTLTARPAAGATVTGQEQAETLPGIARITVETDRLVYTYAVELSRWETTDTIASFPQMEKTYTSSMTNGGSLYADWTMLEGGTAVDLTKYDPSFLRLHMVMTLTASDEEKGARYLDNGWIKLRSPDNNGENNYGWLTTGMGLHLGENVIDIPVFQPDGYRITQTGTIDWTQVERLITVVQLGTIVNEVDFTMTLSDVRLVDTSPMRQQYTDALQALLDTPVDLTTADANAVEMYRSARSAAVREREQQTSLCALQETARRLAAAIEKLPTSTFVRGDVDGDGAVTVVDALMTLQAAAGKVTLTDAQQRVADVDGSAGVTASDALTILQRATGRISAFSSNNS